MTTMVVTLTMMVGMTMVIMMARVDDGEGDVPEKALAREKPKLLTF